MTERIDLLECQWFAKRTDAPDGLPLRLLETLREVLPEALPTRFGSSPPLRHSLADGDGLFHDAWYAGSAMLFWQATDPCLGGQVIGLGSAPVDRRTVPRHPVGSVKLLFDLAALDQPQWRDEVVDLFGRLVDVTHAFFAHAHVTRNWGYSGRSPWSDGETQTRPRLVVGERWRGLPPFPLWLAWCGPLYAPFVEGHGLSGFRQAHGGLLRRDGDLPTDAHPPGWPNGLAMQVTATAGTEPAVLIPQGL